MVHQQLSNGIRLDAMAMPIVSVLTLESPTRKTKKAWCHTNSLFLSKKDGFQIPVQETENETR